MTETHVILTKQKFDSLMSEIRDLKSRIKELESKLGKNSSNSSKPPSSDGYKKVIQNNREKSDKPQGAQPGHEGTTLKMVDTADKIIVHEVAGTCSGCGLDLKNAGLKNIQRRQVFDLPEKLMEVTEHRVEVKQCQCGMVHEAVCEVKGNVQYGGKIKAVMVYLNQYQMLPFERLQELSEVLFSMRISDGVLAMGNEACFDNLEQTETDIKQRIMESAVIHNDETGIRCEGKTQWIHSSSTDQYTHYDIHARRGKEAMDAIGILPEFKGVSVHDRWASYDAYDCTHALCNAHLLRDLKSLSQETGSSWADKMISLLVQANKDKKAGVLTVSAIAAIEKMSEQILKEGIEQEPIAVQTSEIKRGRKAKSKSLNLLEVFLHRREQVWAFIYNPDVPFDNNLAERDLRMVKLKQKISGCFRSINGAKTFCRIRSYISTARKHGYDILDAITKALNGKPIDFRYC